MKIITKQINEAAIPSRILYSMFRVSDLELSIAFYRDGLGMGELKRETFKQGRFTLVFMGYGDESSEAMIELTYWDREDYSHGTGYGHVTLEVDETGEREVIVFLEDPDGYKLELIEA